MAAVRAIYVPDEDDAYVSAVMLRLGISRSRVYALALDRLKADPLVATLAGMTVRAQSQN